MKKHNALKLLSGNFDYLQKNFAVSRLSIFGSVARDRATEKSDIDILVEFIGKATFDNYMDLKFYLQDILHTGVDLVTRKALRPQIKEQIEKELVDVKK